MGSETGTTEWRAFRKYSDEDSGCAFQFADAAMREDRGQTEHRAEHENRAVRTSAGDHAVAAGKSGASGIHATDFGKRPFAGGGPTRFGAAEFHFHRPDSGRE